MVKKRLRKKPVCEACGGRGWALFHNTSRDVYEIERCDACMEYDSDREAGDVAVAIIEDALTARDLLMHGVGALRQPSDHVGAAQAIGMKTRMVR